ncbi:TIGR00159 family protein [Aerococcaceae bacterium DSM 111176]|nr:TIGR00159 family protein [Aerococcaceae bacterium DSM 111176]
MSNQPLIQLIDIAIVWYIIYKLLIYARGTQMMNLLKGVGIFIFAKFLSATLGLQTIDWLLGQVLGWGVIAAIVLFQPELRRALEILGRNLSGSRLKVQNPSKKLIDDLEYAVNYMSRRKIGALIAIEGQDELGEIIETGVTLDSEISNQLLINVFIPNTPLHDGAMVIQDFRIAAASCYLPLSENGSIPKELGTRHRAAIGLGEVTDALVLIVSEETGDISLVKEQKMHRGVKSDGLRELLEEYLIVEEEAGTKDPMEQIRGLIANSFKSRGGQDEK